MIKIKIIKNKHNIQKLIITGHAYNYCDGNFEGNLVCAAITGIITGGLNALNKLLPDINKLIQVKISEGFLDIDTIYLNNQNLNYSLNFIKWQLYTIYKQYKNHIKWIETN